VRRRHDDAGAGLRALKGASVTIDDDKLAALLADQRWFGGRGRVVDAIEVLDEAIIEDGPPALVFALLSVGFEEGERWLYHTPLLVDADGGARDAFEDVERLRVVGDLMAHGNAMKGRRGSFHFGGPGLDPLSPPGLASIRAIETEQSNTSLVLDEQIILKLFRRVEQGANPDLELNLLLTNEGFEHVPPQVGEIVYQGELEGEEISIDLGIAQRFVAHAAEGWAEVLHRLNRLFDEVHPADVPEDIRALTEQRVPDIIDSLERLGEATAAMHVALSRDELGPEFVPEPITRGDLNVWSSTAANRLQRLLRSDERDLRTLEADIRDRIDAVTALQDDLGFKSRLHGDYHLGQVLLGNRHWMIIDFEGEPSRPLYERRAKQSALKDVAGMLRSFSYGPLVALFERVEKDSDEWHRLSPWGEAWESLAREKYLNSYLSRSHEGRFLPHDRDVLMTLLEFFELDKALYELEYERAHRPNWAWIPLHGIRRLVEGS
jgi:trehalose synthase-fused probable maltokinase